MPVEPALAVLQTLDAAEKAAYDDVFPAAVSFSTALPLVRVVVPHGGSRNAVEIDDVLRDGKLLPAHKSDNSRAQERALGASDGIYFHGGRTHPQYGKVALVFHRLPYEDRSEVTPFGLGGLLCRGSGETHDQRGCVAPVSHLPPAEQAQFVAASTWTGDWRDKAPCFLAAYFGTSLDRYFADGEGSRPLRLDSAGIFHPLTGTCDWRAWTFEVRIAAEIDLHRAVEDGHVMMWAMEEQLYNEILLRSTLVGGAPWWFAKLLQTRRVSVTNATFEELLRAIDAEVKRACLT